MLLGRSFRALMATAGLALATAACPTNPPEFPDAQAGTSSSSAGDETSSSSGELATGSESTSGEPLGRCGDGIVDAGEDCDDGNADDRDGCTSLCTPPSCSDGIESGNETGIDCGGACGGCEAGAACSDVADCAAGLVCDAGWCALPASCAVLLAGSPGTASGPHALDPDGDGTGESFECDMELDGGGWTRVLLEDFETSDGSAWSASSTSACGALGMMLGGFGNFAGVDVERPVDLFAITHEQARLLARYVKIDSWDNETAYALIDALPVWQMIFGVGSGPANHCGTDPPEAEQPIDVIIRHAESTMTLGFGSTLDEPPNNESWGVDDIEIWLR